MNIKKRDYVTWSRHAKKVKALETIIKNFGFGPFEVVEIVKKGIFSPRGACILRFTNGTQEIFRREFLTRLKRLRRGPAFKPLSCFRLGEFKVLRS